MRKKDDVKYYSRRELIKEIADQNNMSIYDVTLVIDLLNEVILDKLSSGDSVEIGLFPGLKLTANARPINQFKFKNVVDTNYDYILNVGIKTTQLFKGKIRDRRSANEL